MSSSVHASSWRPYRFDSASCSVVNSADAGCGASGARSTADLHRNHHVLVCIHPRGLLYTLSIEFLHEVGHEFRLVLGHQMIDLRLLQTQFGQVQLHLFPVSLPLLPFGQIELGHQLLHPLQGDRVAILVVVLDDVLLVFRVVRHESMHLTDWLDTSAASPAVSDSPISSAGSGRNELIAGSSSRLSARFVASVEYGGRKEHDA